MLLVDLERVGMSRPERPLFRDVSVTVATGDRLGIVGINGTGKTTLLRVLVGELTPETGVVRRGSGARISFLDQDPTLPAGPALAAVGEGWEAEAALTRLGMGAHFATDVSTLSGGQRKRVALARALVQPADLLVLDEPTNHLDVEGIAWLEERLASFNGGLVLVTHDRHVLDRVTNRILELDRGSGYVHQGGYASYLDARAERELREAKAEDVRRNLARSELAWLRRGAPARTRKPKARIEAATAIVEGRRPAAARAANLDLHIAATPRLGNTIVELHDVRHGFEEGRDLFAGVELLLQHDERLGIVGPNGAGKTTLLEIIASRLEPRGGRVVVGPTVQLGYWDQLGRALDPSLRAIEVVAGPNRRPDWSDEAFLERFWFDADAAWAPVGLLSGGERRRLQLVATLAARPNVLLLDEPTNDLDLDTLRALEDFLDDWPGALIVVSHDRAFLERTVTDVLVVDGSGRVTRRPGGLASWLTEQRTAASRGGSGRPAPAASGGATAASRGGGAKAAGSSATTGGAAPKRRSQSTLRQLIKETDKRMNQLGRRRAELVAELENASSSGDHKALAAVGTTLAEVEAELAAAEERWLELAEEAEGS